MKKLSLALLAVGLAAVAGFAAGGIRQLDDATFRTAMASLPGPVIVDFYADWCGPCRAFAPTFASVAAALPQYAFVKVNVDNARAVSAQYNITGIPYIVAIKDGKVLEEYSGARTVAAFTAWVRKIHGAAGGTAANGGAPDEVPDANTGNDGDANKALPTELPVWSNGSAVINQDGGDGWTQKTLKIVNRYEGPDGVYVAVYSRSEAGSVYPVGGGIHVMGLIRVKGTWEGRIAIPEGFAGKDISADAGFKRLASDLFPACRGGGWVGGDTGGFFGKE